MQGLLIETSDKRKFFTHLKNEKQILEFSKIFDAKVSKIKIKNEKVLEIEELVSAICSSVKGK